MRNEPEAEFEIMIMKDFLQWCKSNLKQELDNMGFIIHKVHYKEINEKTLHMEYFVTDEDEAENSLDALLNLPILDNRGNPDVIFAMSNKKITPI